MEERSVVKVFIDNKEYEIAAFADENYLNDLAAYINDVIFEINSNCDTRMLSSENKNLMLELTLANKYFKEKEKVADATLKIDSLEKELYDLKHKISDLESKKSKI